MKDQYKILKCNGLQMKTILNLKDQKYTLNLNSQMAEHSRIVTRNRT